MRPRRRAVWRSGARVPAMTSARNHYALDALSFFIADVQTGFGPFIAVYLATSGWSEGEIGRALSVGALVAVVSQLPGGAAVDRLADKRIAAAIGCAVVGIAALAFAFSTSTVSVMSAEVLHSFGSAMLGPAVAAVSLAVVGRAGLGLRLGRNARFAAIGNGAAAGLLGAAGSYLSPRAVFWLTAAFMVPGLAALRVIAPPRPEDPEPAAGTPAPSRTTGVFQDLKALARDKAVLGFASCIALFHTGNAALLPLASAHLSQSLGTRTNLVVAAAVVVPQTIVALISPSVGHLADTRGPRLVLTLGFAAVPLRAALLGLVSDPYGIIAVQALDGIGAATFGVMVPLVAAELTRGTNRFNLCLGLFGLATGAGASVSTSLAGTLADHFGNRTGFFALALCGLGAVAAAFLSAPRSVGDDGPTARP